MKKVLLALGLATAFVIFPLQLEAKAGSSSSSSTRTSTNVGTKAYRAPAKTQYSSTAIQPTRTIQPTTSTQSTASRPSPTTTSSTATPTPTTTNTTTHTVEQSSGSGIGTAIVGSLIGSTVGTVVGNSINGNHTAGTTIVNNSQPQPYQSTGMTTTNTAITSFPIVAQPSPTRSGWWFIWFMYGLLATISTYLLYSLYKHIKTKFMMRTMSYEKNIPTLANQYVKIQTLVSLNTMDSKLQLTKLCTPQMYHYLTTIASENADKSQFNIVNSIKVLDCTTREVVVDTDTSSVYHSVKIRAQFIDYFIDETGTLTSGSTTTPITDIEVWTFVLNNGESTWRLSAIEEYRS